MEYRKSKLFFVIMLILSTYLIISFADHTTTVVRHRGWFTQPYIAPLTGLGILAFFSLIKLLTIWRRLPDEPTWAQSLASNLGHYHVVLVTCVLFVIYIYGVGVIGFALATLLFVLALLWLSRLLNWIWTLNAFAAVALIVLIFRVGVNIWFPDPMLYEAVFSGELLWFMNQYL